MRVRASKLTTGSCGGAGINSWWNQEAPGVNQMRRAGRVVEAAHTELGQISKNHIMIR